MRVRMRMRLAALIVSVFLPVSAHATSILIPGEDGGGLTADVDASFTFDDTCVSASCQLTVVLTYNSVDGNLSRIYLTGGTALVPQLPKAIQDRSRIPVQILDPFHRTAVDERRFDVGYLKMTAPVAAVAFGLALRRPGDN